MHRLFGTVAIFAGWLSVVVGAGLGLVQSQFFGLAHKEGPVPALAVYGIGGNVVLWCFAAAALLLTVPMLAAMVAVDPRRTLTRIAVGMGIAGLALLPDELGRAFGLPLLPGAVCVWYGGQLISQDALTGPATHATPEAGPIATSNAAGTSEPGPVPTSNVSPERHEPAAAETRRTSAGKPRSRKTLCPWCSAVVPAGAESCPGCHAVLAEGSAESVAIPGVTEVSPALRDYERKVRIGKSKPNLLRMIFSEEPIPTAIDAPAPSDAGALLPPSSAVKAEMARLDAEIAAGAVPLGDAAPTAPPALPPAPPAASPAPDAAPESRPAEPAATAAPKRRRNPRT